MDNPERWTLVAPSYPSSTRDGKMECLADLDFSADTAAMRIHTQANAHKHINRNIYIHIYIYIYIYIIYAVLRDIYNMLHF